MEKNRRIFLKQAAVAGTAAVTGSLVTGCQKASNQFEGTINNYGGGKLIVPKANALQLSGTFVDEISGTTMINLKEQRV